MVHLGQNKAFQIARESLRGGTSAVSLTTADGGGSLHGMFA